MAEASFDDAVETADSFAERQRLRFPSAQELRERVATVFTSGIYTVPPSLATTLRRVSSHAAQTEAAATRDMAVGASRRNVDGFADDYDGESVSRFGTDRCEELALVIPNPANFPVLTVAQLVEAEKRVTQLLTVLENELHRCVDEDERRARARAESEANAAAQAAAAQAASGIGGGDVGVAAASAAFVSADTWAVRMDERLMERLRARNRDVEGTTAATRWHREKLVGAALPQRDRQETASPRRERSLSIASSPPIVNVAAMFRRSTTPDQDALRRSFDGSLLNRSLVGRKTSFRR